MKKYVCVGKWKVWGTCGFNHWTILDWTDDYEEAQIAKQRAEAEECETFNRHYWIEENITILEPLE